MGEGPGVLEPLSWGALLRGSTAVCLHRLQTQRQALPDRHQNSLPCDLASLEAGCFSKHEPSAESGPRPGKASLGTQISPTSPLPGELDKLR